MSLAPLISIVLPVFAIVIGAYAVARAVALPVWLTANFQRLVFDVAVPVLLFHTMATVDLTHHVNSTLILAYYLPTLALYGLIYFGAQRLGRAQPLANSLALSGTYSNAVLLGIPLLLRAFGDAAAVPLFALISLHAAAMFFLTTLLYEIGAGKVHFGNLLLDTARRLLTNPILLGLLAGLAANLAAQLLNTPLPTWLLLVTGSIRAVAPNAALVAMGIGLASYALRGALIDASAITFAKLVLHPLLVAVTALWLLPVPLLWAQVAVAVAALPCGINVYLFAARYGQGEAASATAILVSTGLSIFTLSLVLMLMGVGGLAAR